MQSKIDSLGRIVMVAAVVAILAAAVAAEVVYTTDGRKITGTVTHEGDSVIIDTEDGRQLILAADQILHIAYLPDDDKDEDTDDGDDEQAEPSDPVETTDEEAPTEELPRSGFEDSGNVVPAPITFSMADATHPESIAFMLMRRSELTRTTGDGESHDVTQWQAAAHDRLRRYHSTWLKPSDFTVRRDKYAKLLEEARETLKELDDVDNQQRSKKISQADADKLRRRLKAEFIRDLKRAAALWADPAIRSFLEGIAYYREENWESAAEAFNKARKAGPLVAAHGIGYRWPEVLPQVLAPRAHHAARPVR